MKPGQASNGVVTGPMRRNDRSILAEVGLKGARVEGSARRHDLTRQHIYQWRGEFRRRYESAAEETGFPPVEIAAAPTVTSASVAIATVEILLAIGRRLQADDGLSPSVYASRAREDCR